MGLAQHARWRQVRLIRPQFVAKSLYLGILSALTAIWPTISVNRQIRRN